MNDSVEHKESASKLQNYYFIVYFSNPSRDMVTAYIDGDENPLILNHSEFLKIIRETINFDIISQVVPTLATYGTHYLLDRDMLTVTRISVKGDIEESSVSRLAPNRIRVQRETERGNTIDSTLHTLAHSSINISGPVPTVSF